MKINFSKLAIISVLVVLAAGLFLTNKIIKIWPNEADRGSLSVSEAPVSSFLISPSPSKIPTPAPASIFTPSPSVLPTLSILLETSFFAQAPFGEWNDPIFQDGCEEASIIMAWNWVQDKVISKERAKQEILDLSDFETNNFGYAPDRSAADTAHLMKIYTGHQNISVRHNIGAAEIKEELFDGNMIITPVNGRILKNPFYTPPGPEHHMVVVIGYDGVTNEFITNDIGTRHGEKFRYSAAHFEKALQDYPTGNHLPATLGVTAMIVVEPK